MQIAEDSELPKLERGWLSSAAPTILFKEVPHQYESIGWGKLQWKSSIVQTVCLMTIEKNSFLGIIKRIKESYTVGELNINEMIVNIEQIALPTH